MTTICFFGVECIRCIDFYYSGETMSNHDDDGNGSHELIPQKKPKIPALFQDLGLGTVTTKDKFSVSYSGGVLKATVKRSSGVSQTVLREVGSGFRAMTEFDPGEMKSKTERNNHIRKAASKGATQQDLAEQFGLSQSMINRIVNKP